MPDPIINLFMNFRSEKHDIFSDIVSSPNNYKILVDCLIDYLEISAKQQWIDEETLDLLAFDIGKISPSDFLKVLRDQLERLKDPQGVYKHFTIRLGDGEASSVASINSLPSDAELKKVITAIKSGKSQSLYQDITEIIGKYTAYCFASGDLEPAYKGMNDIFFNLQNNIKIEYNEYHFLIVNAITDIFQVDATDERMWIRWSHSFRRIGDFESAELILWEAFRRRPESSRVAFSLLKSLGRTKYNYQNRMRLADYLCQRFSFNRWIEIERNRLKGSSRSFSQVVEGIRGVIGLINRANDQAFFEVSLLASLLSHNWTKLSPSPTLPQLLNEVEDKFGDNPRLLGRIAYRLMRDHGNVEAAEAILHNEHAFRVTNAELMRERRGRFAGLLSRFGGNEGLERGIDLLRSLDTIRDRNHLAKLLAMRGAQGDAVEAEQLLRQNLIADPNDEYALVQLATLIHTHNIGPNSKEKALSLLDEIASYNSYARMVRAAITNGIEINQNVEIDSALDKTPKVGAMLEESDEFVFTKPFVNGHSFGIPKSVILNARLRKLKFEMDFGTKLSAEQALVEIEVINEANEGSYLTFISERYGSCGDLEDDSGQGAALLVKAFENVDLGLITEACEMVPRFSAVAELARSVIVTGKLQMTTTVTEMM